MLSSMGDLGLYDSAAYNTAYGAFMTTTKLSYRKHLAGAFRPYNPYSYRLLFFRRWLLVHLHLAKSIRCANRNSLYLIAREA